MCCSEATGDKLNDNKKWPQYSTVLIVLIIVFTTGIHIGWPSPSLPKLLSDDYPLKLTPDDASYVVAIASFGTVIGSILFSIFADVIGRKIGLLLIAPNFILSMVLIHFSTHSIILLYLGRIFGGVGEGACVTLVPIYVCEVSEPRVRGSLMSFFTLFWFGGVLFINLVGTRCSIETTSLISLTFPVVFLVLFWTMPESPYYLLMKNKVESAQKSLQRLRHTENTDDELAELTKDVERQMSETGRLQDLFLIASNRTALIILTGLTIIQIFTGIVSLSSYAQIFFAHATDVIPEDWAAVLLLLIKLLLSFVTIAIVDITGRKLLLLFSTAGCSLAVIFLSVFFFLKDYSSLKVDNVNWIPLLGMILLTITYVLGLGVVVTCLLGELFSASVKVKGVCVINVVYAIATFGCTKLYQSLADNYSIGLPLLIYGAVQIIGFAFCWRYVPETKGKTLEEIQQEFKNKERATTDNNINNNLTSPPPPGTAIRSSSRMLLSSDDNFNTTKLPPS